MDDDYRVGARGSIEKIDKFYCATVWPIDPFPRKIAQVP